MFMLRSLVMMRSRGFRFAMAWAISFVLSVLPSSTRTSS
jgi:hypothetical protein